MQCPHESSFRQLVTAMLHFWTYSISWLNWFSLHRVLRNRPMFVRAFPVLLCHGSVHYGERLCLLIKTWWWGIFFNALEVDHTFTSDVFTARESAPYHLCHCLGHPGADQDPVPAPPLVQGHERGALYHKGRLAAQVSVSVPDLCNIMTISFGNILFQSIIQEVFVKIFVCTLINQKHALLFTQCLRHTKTIGCLSNTKITINMVTTWWLLPICLAYMHSITVYVVSGFIFSISQE